MSIGTKIKALRLKAGLTQVQLAQAAGILQGSLACYEQDRDIPSAPRLIAIAKVLGTTAEELIDESSLPASAVEPKPLVHGNSTKALIQKLVEQLNPDHQKAVLAHVKALMKAEEAETLRATPSLKDTQKATDTPKRRRNAA